MATQLFKDGESIYVPAKSVQSHISAGWSFNDPDGPVVPQLEVIYPPHINPVTMSEPELQSAILKEMGIEIKHPEPVKRRGRTKKAA